METTTNPIRVDQSACENGLALMLCDLLSQNLQQHPSKKDPFLKLGSSVAISALDAEVELTIQFDHGNCTIVDGVVGKPDLHIKADSETILGLSSLPIVLGLPNLLASAGRQLAGKLTSGKLKIHGILSHPVTLIRLTRLFSVHG